MRLRLVFVMVLLAGGCGGPTESPSLALVAHLEYEMGADLQFQRRSGSHIVDGQLIKGVRDYVFASAHSDPSRDDGGIEIIDVTDPTNPEQLVRIPCPGYQGDVAVHEALLLQTVDFSESNGGCDPDWLTATGSEDVDRAKTTGLRVFDVTDPLHPDLLAFIELGSGMEGVHNVTVLPWAGIAYLAELDGDLGIVDLNDPDFPYVAVPVASISPHMVTSCHDVGLDPIRKLAFCPASEQETYILDVSEPLQPRYVSKINNPALSRHHGARMAPDGNTLVLQAEFDHPPAVASDASAGLWFYDLTTPGSPVLFGSWAPTSCEPSERENRACSSHWFNFAEESVVSAAWRHHGLFLVDFTDPALPKEAGYFRPTSFRPGAHPDFWAAYHWHGFIYANSGAGLHGLYILKAEGIEDDDPSPFDEGTSWGRWTSTS